MFYINTMHGMLVHDENARPRIRYVTDVREATPFASFEQADTFAKERVVSHLPFKQRYYAILTPGPVTY